MVEPLNAVKLLDVHVVLAAHRADHPDHPTARRFLDELLDSGEQFGVPWTVWWSYLRLSSHPRIFGVPTPIADAFGYLSAIRSPPGQAQPVSGLALRPPGVSPNDLVGVESTTGRAISRSSTNRLNEIVARL